MTATPDKGRGLFAKKTLPAGFLLFEDEPLFTPGSLMKDILKEMQSWKGQKMPSCQTLERQAIPGVHWKMVFWELHNAFPSTGCHEVGVYRTNRVQTSREHETVFRKVSLMNRKLSWEHGGFNSELVQSDFQRCADISRLL